MQSTLTLFELLGVSAARPALMAATGTALAGFAFTIFRGRLSRLRLFGPSDCESLMNFASLGTLRCVCGAAHQEGLTPNRRRFCRICGCEVVRQDRAMLGKQLSKREIEQLTRRLRRAAIRARNLDLPPSITDIDELYRYLGSDSELSSRNLPPPPTAEASQVH